MTSEQTKAPGAAVSPAADIDPREARRIAYCIYGVMILGMAAQFSLYTFAPGTVALICAVIYAHLQRKELYGTLFENHYRWMTRSFWIGGAVYLPIATICMSIYQVMKLDMTEMFRAMYDGEEDPLKLTQLLLSGNAEMILNSTLLLAAVFAVWWWARCLTGLYYLRRGSPLPNVMRWL
jgi:uncharacterized membrane protein